MSQLDNLYYRLGDGARPNKVDFICHSQGGTTARYLIQLLSGAPNGLPKLLAQYRQDWVRSITILGTPSQGTTVIDVVNVYSSMNYEL